MNNKLLFPVFEFRPLDNEQYLRYANGDWIKDDGKYDLAFVGMNRALGISLPYYENILWSWCKNGRWMANVPKHPKGNAWHYMLREGKKDWGERWARERHPNSIAYESAMDMCSYLYGCANGGGVEMNINNPYIKAGLVRNIVTKEILRFPDIFDCIYCGKINWRDEEG